jgi:hypothetical protein
MPRHILFSNGGPSAATAFNYQHPTEIDFKANTTAQLDAQGGGDPRHFQTLADGGGAGDTVALHFAIDTDYTYSVFTWFTGATVAADNGGVMTLREGTNCSTTDATSDSPGTRIADNYMESGSGRNGAGGLFNHLRPSSGRDAEWGVQFGDMSLASSCVIAFSNEQFRPKVLRFPEREIFPAFNGFINRDGWAQHLWESESGGDTDVTSEKKAFTIPFQSDNEEWLFVITGRNENDADHASGDPTDNRYTPYLDGPPSFGTGVDMFNVRTNNITAGATKTGRGFNWVQPVQNFEERLQFHMTVKTLPAGDYEAWWVWNRHQANTDNQNFDNATFNMWRLNHFRNRSYHKITDALTTGSLGSYGPTPWTTEITLPADAGQVLILFATTRHDRGGLDSNDQRFRIQRNGVTLVDKITNTSSGGTTDSHSNVTPSTDNQTAPVHCIWADKPGPGTHTYTVQVNPEVSNTMYNRRDDGSAGYEGGILFVGECVFAQDEAA